MNNHSNTDEYNQTSPSRAKERRQDPLTGESFVPQHLNQKYASKENQVRHNNARARNGRLARQNVQRKLVRNWNILDQLLGQKDEMKVSMDLVHNMGFDFHFLTNQSHDERGRWIGIFNLAYRQTDDKQIQITRYDGTHPGS